MTDLRAEQPRAVGLRVTAPRVATLDRLTEHHLVCRVCGRTEDVDCVVGPAPCLKPSASAGFTVEAAEVVFRGVCPDCPTKPEEDLP